MKIVGKRGRIVPIILTPDMRESIEVSIPKKVQTGIPFENLYVFGIANTSGMFMNLRRDLLPIPRSVVACATTIEKNFNVSIHLENNLKNDSQQKLCFTLFPNEPILN